MKKALEQSGYKYDLEKRSVFVKKEMIDWADKIVIMDNANYRKFNLLYPGYADKVYVIGVKDPNFSPGIDEHLNAVKKIETYIKQNLCAG